jgi:hypothetical protein
MLPGTDELLTTAQLAMALAGFSGVVSVFMQSGPLEKTDGLRFLIIFASGISVLALSFVPLVLNYAGLDSSSLWRISSLVQFLAFGGNLVYFGPRLLSSDVPKPPLAIMVVATGGNWLMLGLQVANVIGWPMSPGPFAYLAGLWIFLVSSATFFAGIILLRPSK